MRIILCGGCFGSGTLPVAGTKRDFYQLGPSFFDSLKSSLYFIYKYDRLLYVISMPLMANRFSIFRSFEPESKWLQRRTDRICC